MRKKHDPESDEHCSDRLQMNAQHRREQASAEDKALDAAVKLVTTRERQIVRVARVRRAGRFRQSGQSAIGAIGADIRERGRGRRALR